MKRRWILHRLAAKLLSRAELEAVIKRLPAPYRLIGALLYGCGLRLSECLEECLELRIHCFHLDSGLLTVHDGKGQRDRTVPLPARVLATGSTPRKAGIPGEEHVGTSDDFLNLRELPARIVLSSPHRGMPESKLS